MFDLIISDMQAAFSALGAFVCFWGFVQFAPCLWRVLLNNHFHPQHSGCPYHASMAMLCLSGLTFSFARMNTIGYFRWGTVMAGMAYMAGMLVLVVTVGLSVWAMGRTHEQARLSQWRTPVPNTPNLARILAALLIVTLAFIGVGALRVGS